MIVFLAVGLVGRVAVLAVGCVSGIALMLLTKRHLQVVDVFAQVRGNFVVDDAFKLQARDLVPQNVVVRFQRVEPRKADNMHEQLNHGNNS